LYYCGYEQIDTCYVPQGSVMTLTRRGGWFCHHFVANSFMYLCAKNYQNRTWFDKVIENERVQCFCLTVYINAI